MFEAAFMKRLFFPITRLLLATLLTTLSWFAGAAAAIPGKVDAWTDVVRAAPYWSSQGVYRNVLAIRSWVLNESSYCTHQSRHIFYDMHGQFLGWSEDTDTVEANQQQLNSIRQDMFKDGRSSAWAAGAADVTGYPFALACDQPHVDLPGSIARYLGQKEEDRLWGAWDDIKVGGQGHSVSLHKTLMAVYKKRNEQKRLSELPPALPRYLAGQLLIESGGQTRAHSTANARGIMQLSPAALSDCRIPPKNYWHRLAQIDCALQLSNQNARNLRPSFADRFGELPAQKRDELFSLLLIQAYHGGAGRVKSLLQDELLSRPAEYFARHQARYSAGDIAFGMIFHNLGRDRLGLSSLYYVADVQLATKALCESRELKNSEFCQWP
jgi:hypothetical protein